MTESKRLADAKYKGVGVVVAQLADADGGLLGVWHFDEWCSLFVGFVLWLAPAKGRLTDR